MVSIFLRIWKNLSNLNSTLKRNSKTGCRNSGAAVDSALFSQSNKRCTNENTNGLIRQYFSKGRDFRTITEDEIIHAMRRLNNRPRKRSGYKTPNEVFFGMESTVALTT